MKPKNGSYKNRRIQKTKTDLNSRIEETENKVLIDHKDKNKIRKDKTIRRAGQAIQHPNKEFAKRENGRYKSAMR